MNCTAIEWNRPEIMLQFNRNFVAGFTIFIDFLLKSFSITCINLSTSIKVHFTSSTGGKASNSYQLKVYCQIITVGCQFNVERRISF